MRAVADLRSNKLSVDVTDSSNPVVPFSEYAKANPYYRKVGEGGSVEKWLERPEPGNKTQDASVYAGNPLYNASLTSYSTAKSFGVRDNFNLEYRPLPFLYVRGRVGLYKGVSKGEDFTSPEDTSFENADKLKKGSYTTSQSETFNWDADFTVTYGQLLGDKHQINAVLGTSARQSEGVSDGYTAIGFPEGNFTTPAFATQFSEGGKPYYSESTSRSCNFFFNGGYSFMNRYLLDANLRADGTSVFGSNRKFTTTWAVGLAWNIHNEPFMKRLTKNFFTMFKIRGSVGNPGNQNFGAFNTLTTYKYNNWMLNNFGTGLLINTFGNPDLNWQKTINLTVGLDLSIRDRFHVTFDVYRKNTDPLLANIGVASSVGVTTRLANIGKQVTQGYDGTVRYSIIYRPQDRINWTTSLSFRHTTSYYDNIGETLAQYNNENIAKNLTRYYDGGSPTALWAVRSAGIDPATGREIFITRDGRYTFTHSYDDEVEVGDTNPTVEGVWGNTFYWKGFSCSVYVRYSYGAQAFNRTVYNKVENISTGGLTQNQDKRALYDRWQKPGDVAQFKGISITDTTPMSSRFVQDNNYIVLESVRVGWEVPYKFTRRIGVQGLTLSAYMNDICRLATIEAERGISYPFARSVSMALSVNF